MSPFPRRYRDRGGELPAPSILDNVRMSSSQSGKSLKFVFVKKHEICRPSTERDKCCRVMAVSEYQVCGKSRIVTMAHNMHLYFRV